LSPSDAADAIDALIGQVEDLITRYNDRINSDQKTTPILMDAHAFKEVSGKSSSKV
jgi:hypothetical protein